MINYIKYQIKCIKRINLHRKAIVEIEKQTVGRNTIAIKLHDIDKIIMLALMIPKDLTSKIHRLTSPHHKTSYFPIKNYYEMVFDWESARYTKPEKQLTARQTIELDRYTHLKDKILPILDKYNL